MKKIVLVLAAMVAIGSSPVLAGNCDYSWQKASDGSSCGDRAADKREGGN